MGRERISDVKHRMITIERKLVRKQKLGTEQNLPASVINGVVGKQRK